MAQKWQNARYLWYFDVSKDGIGLRYVCPQQNWLQWLSLRNSLIDFQDMIIESFFPFFYDVHKYIHWKKTISHFYIQYISVFGVLFKTIEKAISKKRQFYHVFEHIWDYSVKTVWIRHDKPYIFGKLRKTAFRRFGSQKQAIAW